MEVTREMAHAMAAWWGDKISGHGAWHDNGDHNNLASVFAGLLADTMTEEADESKVNKFVDILTEKILEQANDGHLFELRYNLDCDYAPSQFLSEAAKEAGIKSDNFPWKTSMAIRENQNGETIVEVSAGYGASWEQIYPIKNEENSFGAKTFIKQQKWGNNRRYIKDVGMFGEFTEEGKKRYFK